MSELLKRAIFGSLYVIVLVACTYFHPISLLILFLGLTILATKELIAIFSKCGIEIQVTNAYILSILTFIVFIAPHYYSNNSNFAYLLVITSLIMFIYELYRNKTNGIVALACSLFPALFVGFAFACLVKIAFLPPFLSNDIKPNSFSVIESGWHTIIQRFNPDNLILVYILVWVNDTFAYLSGRLFGKHKLMESISPKKTWEGFMGGLILTAITASILLYLQSNSINKAILGIILGLIVSIGSTYGDLVESMAKRNAKIKDSGQVIPGHGGILDRLDSLLFIGPLLYAIISLLW